MSIEDRAKEIEAHVKPIIRRAKRIGASVERRFEPPIDYVAAAVTKSKHTALIFVGAAIAVIILFALVF